MGNIAAELLELAESVRLACIEIRTKINGNVLTLDDLNTTAKGSLVAAVNELKSSVDGLSSEDPRINASITSIAITAEQLVIVSGGVTYTLNAQIP